MLIIPKILQSNCSLFDKYFSNLEHPLRDAVKTLLAVSNYAGKQIEILKYLLTEDDWQKQLNFIDYKNSLQQLHTKTTQPINKFIRNFRHYHFLRHLLRELSGLATVEETMASWSDCADALILFTLNYCMQEMTLRYGHPEDEARNPVELYILAMGKLGGQELNYSSDIDLIMAFSASGYTTGVQQVDNQYFFTKVVQLFIQLMQNVTEDGFVFRVDLRLRPNGESGALVSSLAAMETYYQEQGRDWERYAMVKARLISASPALRAQWFQRLITPFVYRRYIDFSVIESLRSMKAMIEREVQLNPTLDDIKRGFGGIREVEFIVQSIQLIRGGRIPRLQQPNLVKALSVLKEEQLLSRSDVLTQAYLFLRKLENCLQSENDQQIHALPTEPIKQAKIALAMGFVSWDSLLQIVQRFRKIIRNLFLSVLKQAIDYDDSDKLLDSQLNNVWQGHAESTMAINLLTSLGYQDAERCYQLLSNFRHGPRCRRLNQAARLRLDRFMTLLLRELANVANTSEVLLNVIHLLENIVTRSAYITLFTENPQALRELFIWFNNSAFIRGLLVNHPFLLEILLDQGQEWQPVSRTQLQEQLQKQLLESNDLELQEEILRQFKLTNWLLIARAEQQGNVSALQSAYFLSMVAEVIVEQVVKLALIDLGKRYPQIPEIKSNFAIIAYGKLGSQEMNYNSDLDLVFIYDNQLQEESLVTRLTQKILHMLTTRSQSGLLYKVDTRLRPSGEAGLLVSAIKSFIDYQKNQAWLWEHQALIRARVIFGNTTIHSQFKNLKQSILLIERPKEWVFNEIKAMRQKINRHLKGEDEIKYTPGGLIDLEFFVQFLILTNPTHELSRETNTLSLIKKLAECRVIEADVFKILTSAYKLYHKVLHQNILASSKVINYQDKCKEILAIVNFH
ncbi:bifunctional [glutamate--ammonia ligase]-adenylyl-L-tyrosine phosphorylase/[glutamate--ammonia-ligase] adenylyltransferase [Legionella gresilensis]|uniref:bifunctional [glutamate--ammonia ligase]-adenylyl-L-tyrosine phosphorylase/[glutamate--ammonia-ligase] adenylyltransferase n=1 Tax=Legionella gresilensis TaxID=91823 RepID=UPI001A94D60B|nr:bifunctional [glutamate--ammonia ligase]-adenylyl-L-tyrosine phosphorylase/[glutamate--ammonia-ligase] adenylyltransferase [Legionella gresilensis]